MQLSKFQSVAKARNGWAAIDLGCVLARAWYFQLWLAWVVPAGILLLICSFIFKDTPIIAGLIVWWFKPVLERPLLFIVSQRIFAENITYAKIVRSYWAVNKTDWYWWLSLRRLLPTRAYLMPVTVLEGLKGKTRAPRVSLLSRRLSGPASWLWITGAHIEMFIFSAILACLAILTPAGISIELEALVFEHRTLTGHLNNLVWFFAASVVAPVYVCSGFALYLQRRIDLEGWDIEIQFRQLAERLKRRHENKLHSLAAVLITSSLLIGSFHSTPVIAQDQPFSIDPENIVSVEIIEDEQAASEQDTSDTAEIRSEIKKQVHEILSQPPFLNEKIENQLGFKEKSEDGESGIPDWLINFIEWLEGKGDFFQGVGEFLRFLASSLEFILWGAVILLVLFVLWRSRAWWSKLVFQPSSSADSEAEAAPKVLFGIAIQDEPLPEELVKEVQKLWQDGLSREAFALLIRGVILYCVDKGCRFKDGFTEYECSQVVLRDLGADIGAEFLEIISHWQQLAYAHRICGDDQFYSLCAIVERWQADE